MTCDDLESSTQCVPTQVVSVCMCALQDHECIDISSTVTPPEHSHGSYRSHFCCLSLLENTQNCTTQHTWAPSFIDSQHQVRKEMLFHGEFSFCNKSKGNSVRCCGLTRRNSQTPQIRLHLRARERALLL